MKERNLPNSPKEIRVLLDTSFILPFFGLRVEEIHEEVVNAIIGSREILYIFPKLLIAEVVAVLAKESKKAGMNPLVIKDYIEEFLVASEINFIDPNPHHLILAMELRNMGHKDIFDCIAYATAKMEKAYFLTLDVQFIEFLRKNKLDVNIILSQDNFIQMVKEKS